MSLDRLDWVFAMLGAVLRRRSMSSQITQLLTRQVRRHSRYLLTSDLRLSWGGGSGNTGTALPARSGWHHSAAATL